MAVLTLRHAARASQTTRRPDFDMKNCADGSGEALVRRLADDLMRRHPNVSARTFELHGGWLILDR